MRNQSTICTNKQGGIQHLNGKDKFGENIPIGKTNFQLKETPNRWVFRIDVNC
jgi:hypothetical protein